MHVAIVGSGLSSALLVTQLARLSADKKTKPLRVTVFEKEPDRVWWTGVAYGTPAPWHLINVPSPGMSGLEDDATHLTRWLEAKRASGKVDPQWGLDKVHIPRGMYGEYLRELVDEAVASRGEGFVLNKVRGEVVGVVERDGGQLAVRFASSDGDEAQSELADVVVVASGNFAPANIRFKGSDVFYAAQAARGKGARYLANPWRILASISAVLPQDARVAIIGTRLTAVDVLHSLRHTGHTGDVHLISRNGLWPFSSHAEGFPPPAPEGFLTGKALFNKCAIRLSDGEGQTAAVHENGTRSNGQTASGGDHPTDVAVDHFFEELTSECERLRAAGGVWQAIVDSVRPYFNEFWNLMTTEQRSIFLRKHRAAFEVRRHRVAPGVLEAIAPVLGTATHHVGGIQTMTDAVPGRDDSPITITTLEQPADGQSAPVSHVFEVDYVINCTGPRLDLRTDPPSRLLDDLLQKGWAVPEGTGIGLLVHLKTHELQGQGRAGAHPRLYAIGPPCRGSKWESIAVKEIRSQALLIAKQLVDRL